MYSNAIVCRPCPAITDGITSSNLGKPVYNLALEQHAKYIETLEKLGLKVAILPKKDKFPDSTFIEDVALCTSSCAIITNPAVDSRRNEIEGMHDVLSEYYDSIEEIHSPGTLEAGDVMMTGNHFFIGISNRTNMDGAGQLLMILKRYNLTGSIVRLNKMLHLKSGVSYLENNNMLVSGELFKAEEFRGYNRIFVDDSEAYAANSLWINGKVLVPDGFPETRNKIEQAGYETIALNVSEFRKVDGGLSCLSLRF
jgi:dimethylargininase